MRSVEETIELFPRLQVIRKAIPPSNPLIAGLRQAYQSAQKSNDPNTHVGATIITPEGMTVSSHNHIVGLNNDSARASYPKKLDCSAHAERRAIAHAGRYGKTDQSTLYAPWFSCPGCAIQIGESGVNQVAGHITAFQHTPDRWLESMQLAHAMLDDDYGIPLYVYMEVLGVKGYMNGTHFDA